jgi:hypothetical protein
MRTVMLALAVVLVLAGVAYAAWPRTTVGISEDGQWFRCSARDLYPPGNFWMRLDDLTTVYSDNLRPIIPEGDWAYIGRQSPEFKAYAAVAWPNRKF